jgi:hypothetical protein
VPADVAGVHGGVRGWRRGRVMVAAAGAIAVGLSVCGAVAFGDGEQSAARNAAGASNEMQPVQAGHAEAVDPLASDPVASDLARRLTGDIQPLLAKYCLECHSGTKAKGGVEFESLTNIKAALGMGGDLDLAHELVTTKEMPPSKSVQPSDHERLILEQWLEAMTAYVPPDSELDPGWFTIHRLNRAEYRNTMRDLLGIDTEKFDVASRLPKDDSGYGFDNIADVLTMSPLALEQYLDAAEKAVELGLGPEFVVSTESKSLGRFQGGENGRPLLAGGFFFYSNGGMHTTFEAPATGEYLITINAWETAAGDDRSALSLRIDGKEVKKFEISGYDGAAEEVTHKLRLRAGKRTIAAHFTNDYYHKTGPDRNLAIEWVKIAGPLDEATTKRTRAWDEIFGPSKVIADETQRASDVLGRFASRAYRRPVTESETKGLLDFYLSERAAGMGFERAVRQGLIATLVSPNFLYRSLENPGSDDAGMVYRLRGVELASRLSYFLWSSMPDEALMKAAVDGSLLEDEVLREQVRRMLADEKSDAFVDNFSGQWLQLRMLDDLAMDTKKFPQYSTLLSGAMRTEAKLFFSHILRNNLSIVDFIDSDYTFLNKKLAEFYGVGGVEHDDFQRVTLEEASPRGGVLTMGAVLTVTSNTTRTSPVKRGLYVLDQILGAPPPPPPADIPPLEQSAPADHEASLREQLALHVANPTCAVCHNRLDPIGLAFENFNAVGRWRDKEGGKPIDATGTLPGGVAINGVEDLKKLLVSRADEFVETLTGKVLMYGLGRGLEPFDRPAVRRIADQVRKDENRFGSLIEAVVLSESFRTCRGREKTHEE